MIVPGIEREIGLLAYSTDTPGIGGRIKEFPEDFRVEEMLKNGLIATFQPITPKKIVGKGKFTTCIMIKTGRDTLLTVREISARLGIHPRWVSVGGIKDTRAVTSQFISVKNIPPNRILRLNIPDVAIHPLSFSREAMSSSQLLGNRFTIKIRGFEGGAEEVAETVRTALRQIENNGGAPNFFGHQRFGTVRPISHIAGRFMVKGNFEGAAMAYLSTHSENEQQRTREARQGLLRTGDFEKALQDFPTGLVFERMMIKYLIGHRGDYIGALRSMPVKFLRFLVQAYQSYLFNLTLGERIRRGISLKSVLPGDLISPIDQWGLPEGEPLKVDQNNTAERNEKIREGEAKLVIPLIGYNNALSEGEEGAIEKAVMEAEDIQQKNFYLRGMLDISSMGSYRTALARPREVQDTETETGEKGLCLKLGFWLPKGSYATLILREVMKSRDPIAAHF
jgi:tRNA pseudouridine13 synthase